MVSIFLEFFSFLFFLLDVLFSLWFDFLPVLLNARRRSIGNAKGRRTSLTSDPKMAASRSSTKDFGRAGGKVCCVGFAYALEVWLVKG